MKLPAITILQPWASLMAIGAKQFETRGWQRPYRGPIGLHAAKRWNRELAALSMQQSFRSMLEATGLDPLALPLGRRIVS